MADLLYVYAAPVEAGPLASRADTMALGVGKTAAAISMVARLAKAPPRGVVAFGVAGAHRGGPAVGELVVVDRDRLADEGVATDDGFVDLTDLGLPTTVDVVADQALSARVAAVLEVPRIGGSTVSTCSGTDALAAARIARVPTPEQIAVETMEGAAIGLACAHFGVPWTAIRAISNRTGQRANAGWDLAGATQTLQRAVARVMEAL